MVVTLRVRWSKMGCKVAMVNTMEQVKVHWWPTAGEELHDRSSIPGGGNFFSSSLLHPG
jgi:hypothetical protein